MSASPGNSTPPSDVRTTEPDVEDRERTVPPEIGGGGIGWKQTARLEGIVVLLYPSKSGGGGISTGHEAVASVAQDTSRRDAGDSTERARASAISGTLLGLLAATTSIVWALYKFKPSATGQTDGGFGQRTEAITVNSEALMPMYSDTGAGRRVPVTRLSSATFLVGARRADSVAQTYVSAVGGLELGSTFVSLSTTRVSNAGSGIAGLVTGNGVVTRGTQSDMTALAVSQFHTAGTETWKSEADSKLHVLSRQSTVELATVQTQTSDYPYAGDSFDENLIRQNSGMGYGSGYDESLSSTTISYPSAVETGSTYHPSAAEHSSPPVTFVALQTENSYEVENVEMSYGGEWNQSANGHQEIQGISMVESVGDGPQMAAEVIRVDCVLLTTNGRYVITGSVYGPPQVWDIKTGELVKVMAGTDLSSTDLHLAGGDTLLVGQVADVTLLEEQTLSRSSYISPRLLQIWDLSSGNPLNMPSKVQCTASSLMPDGERIALACTGNSGILLTIWDLPGNQRMKTLQHAVALNPTVHISHVLVSDDGRYVATAYQDASNGKATFVIFDVTSHGGVVGAPKIVAFNAAAEVSTTLDDHEVVIGTRKGELVIWNMSSGKILRQLLQPTSDLSSLASRRGSAALVAHQAEVKAVAVSSDHLYLVSASADQTLNLWHLETERLRFALMGHTREVTCCSFSYDSELIASGSLDCTVRLWQSQDGLPVAVFDAGVDVFRVLVSNNKRTVVALGDQKASRKLIMLQIMRTKTKGRRGSGAKSQNEST